MRGVGRADGVEIFPRLGLLRGLRSIAVAQEGGPRRSDNLPESSGSPGAHAVRLCRCCKSASVICSVATTFQQSEQSVIEVAVRCVA